MTFDQALNLVVANTGWHRYRELCDRSHPSHEQYRSLVIEMAEKLEGESSMILTPPTPSIQTATAVPMPQSPMLAGDLVEALAKRVGAARAAKYIEKMTGKPCGCGGRKLALNQLDTKVRKFLGWTLP